MKYKTTVLFALLFLLCLGGCTADGPETAILVSIEEAEGFTVENNGLRIAPGGDAVFYLNMEPGCSISEVDYKGGYSVLREGKQTVLTLEKVQYPARVRLQLTNRYCSITYSPNGGTGREAAVTYDLTYHLRPNTSTGEGLFSREGWTLTGWNTESGGSGERIGLGSRITPAVGGQTLYAQWEKWAEESDFSYTVEDTVTITGYHGTDARLVVPGSIGGREVTTIAAGAFQNCGFQSVVLPSTIDKVEAGAFQNCALEAVTLFDNIVFICDGSFSHCPNLRTLYINAMEAPYGYLYRKESCYADKVDLLILAQGRQKLVFYGGCSMWYNLDGPLAAKTLGGDYAVINMGLNGTVNAQVQMDVLSAFLEAGDILFHTPELSSRQQLLICQGMGECDDLLWCGLENNYDLFALVDIRELDGVFDSLCHYLGTKSGQSSYAQYYEDDYGRPYYDKWGGILFSRTSTEERLADRVYLDLACIDEDAMARLAGYYHGYESKGVQVYLSYACVNMDAVPEAQRGNVEKLDTMFRQAIEAMDGPVLVSRLEDYLYHNGDFFDTNFHLRSDAARENTALWLRDLLAQMEIDDLWEAP